MDLNPLDIGRLAWLSRNELLTGGALQRLAAMVGSISAIFSAKPDELVAGGASPVQLARFLRLRHGASPEAETERIYKEGQLPIPWTDDRYPAALLPINDPPPILFVRGDPGLLSAAPMVAVVGTRERTAYGSEITAVVTTALTQQGAVIASGLALGIDGDAHTACLDAGGRTLAVLGTGIDDATLYPAHHRDLAARILASGGALVSEYPPGVGRTAYRFPRRNRLVAALAQATIVVEAPRKSGALITAKLAAELGREVFAVPGPVTSAASAGCHQLIADGAMPVVDLPQLLEALRLTTNAENFVSLIKETAAATTVKATQVSSYHNLMKVAQKIDVEPPPASDLSSLSDFEKTIFALHVGERLHPDAIAEKTQRPITEILQAITTLELYGLTTNAQSTR